MRVVERIIGARRGEDVFIHPRWLLQELQMDGEVVKRHLRELAARLTVFDYVRRFVVARRTLCGAMFRLINCKLTLQPWLNEKRLSTSG